MFSRLSTMARLIWLGLVPLWAFCAPIMALSGDREELIKARLNNNPLLIDYFHCLYELKPDCPLSPEAIKVKNSAEPFVTECNSCDEKSEKFLERFIKVLSTNTQNGGSRERK